jgi:uncharacterized protein YuzE
MGSMRGWYDQAGDTLEVTFEDVPAYLEELDEDIFERHSSDGRIVGFMVLNFSKHGRNKLTLPVAVTVIDE